MKKRPGARFVVRGTGTRFPVDMLRYDSAFPESESDSGLITRSVERVGTPAEIRLVTDSPNAPTVKRWRSFGWTVEVIEDR